jgi:hypothetical protein
VHARRRIGGAGAARDEAHAGLPCELAVRLGHHRRATFLAADGQFDRRIVQRVEHGQVAFAGHAEDVAHAVQHELVDQDLAAGAQRGRGGGGFR